MSKLATLLEKILAFVYFLLLPTQTAYHLWLADSILFGRRIDYLSPTLYLTHLISITLLLYWLYKGLLIPSRFSIKFSRSSIILATLLLANCVISPSPLISFYRLISFFLTTLFIANIHHRFGLSSPQVLVPLALSLVWTSFLAWFQWLNQSSVGGLFQVLGERPLLLSLASTAKVTLGNIGLVLRSYATFPHPNALAGYLLVCAMFLLLGLKSTLSRHTSRLLKASFLISMFTLPVTFSRTAIWAFLSLVVVYLWCNSRKPGITKNLLVFIVLILFILSLFIPGNPSSMSERLSQFSHAILLIFLHPLLGVGLGNYLYFSPASLLQLAHNFWLLFLAELGLPLSVFVFYKIFQVFKNSLILHPAAVVLIWPLLITSLTDSYWFTLHQNTSVAIFVLVYLHFLKPSNLQS